MSWSYNKGSVLDHLSQCTFAREVRTLDSGLSIEAREWNERNAQAADERLRLTIATDIYVLAHTLRFLGWLLS